jgi:hypothetical protein
LERVSTLCLALPEATVRVDLSLTRARSTAHSFEIRRRSFCLLVAREGPTGQPLPLLVLRADPDERDALLSVGPPFFAPRNNRDRIGVRLADNTDWEEIHELVTESYRKLAPKKLTGRLDWRPALRKLQASRAPRWETYSVKAAAPAFQVRPRLLPSGKRSSSSRITIP